MQLSYDIFTKDGYEGQVAEGTPQGGIRSAIPAVDVLPGKVLAWDPTGTIRQSAKKPAAAADVNRPRIAGLVVREELRQDGIYEADRTLGVLKKGFMYVYPEDAVTKDSFAFVRHVAGAGEELGALRSDADGTDATQCTGIIFRDSVAAGEPCLVEVDL